MDPSQLERLTEAIWQLAKVAGEAERSQAYLGVQVVANSGSGVPPPVGFVNVRIDGVAMACHYFGDEPAVNDWVDVLKVATGNPIVIGNHTRGLIAQGWPFNTNVFTVDSTDDDADYDDVSNALGAANGETVWLSPETFTDNGSLAGGSNLRGTTRDQSILQTTTQQTCLQITGDGSYLFEITLKNVQSSGAQIYTVYQVGQGATTTFQHVHSIANNSGAGVSVAYYFDGDGSTETAHLIDCWAEGIGTSGYGLYADDATIYIYGGRYDGQLCDIYAASGATIYLFGPVLVNTTSADDLGGAGTFAGWWYDGAGLKHTCNVLTAGDEDGAERVYSVTRTVGSGKDHATIQAAIDWFKGKIIYGSCKIDVDAGTYDEAVVFEDIFLADAGALELEGDTRVLAGISYVDGAACNQAGLANGGSGACSLATNAARDEITVTGAGGNPDFDADGWGAGDDILVFADDGNIYERTIDSVLNNVIDITVALPGGATLGNDGTAICLLPDRQIVRTTAGTCIEIDSTRGVYIDGFYLKTSTGAACHGVFADNKAFVECENMVAYMEDFGLYVADNSYVWFGGGATSLWGASSASRGLYAVYAMATVDYTTMCYGAYGVSLSGFAGVRGQRAVIVNMITYGAWCLVHSMADLTYATARQTVGTAYYASLNSLLYAASTNANNNGNGADYSPAPGIPGSAEGNHYAVLYAS